MQQNELISYEHTLIRFLREQGILQDLDPERITSMEGVILVGCSDKNRFPDLFTHLGAKCQEDRIHTFAWHGGALRLVQESPANAENSPQFAHDLLCEIRDAVLVVARTPTVILTVHLPCGKARLAGLGWLEVLDTLFEAKQRLKQVLAKEERELVIHPVVHIHYENSPEGSERKRSYFFGTKQWVSLRAEIQKLAA